MTRSQLSQAARASRPRRTALAIVSSIALVSSVLIAAACGGDPEGGDCAVKVTCVAADCKTRVRENACICPEGSKTLDQCATPSSDAGSGPDAKPTDASLDAGPSDAAVNDGSSDGTAGDAKAD